MAEDRKITIFDDGPIEIYGPFTVLDEYGRTVAVVEEGEVVYLCRCGGSAEKPFCDGTHSTINFNGAMKSGAASK